VNCACRADADGACVKRQNWDSNAPIVPKAIHKGEPWPKGIEIIEARSVSQALDDGFCNPEKSSKYPVRPVFA